LTEEEEIHLVGKEGPFIVEGNEILPNVPSITTEDWNNILKRLGFDISEITSENLAQLAAKNDHLQQASRVVKHAVEKNLVEAEEQWLGSDSSNIAYEDLAESAEGDEKIEQSSEMTETLELSGR